MRTEARKKILKARGVYLPEPDARSPSSPAIIKYSFVPRLPSFPGLTFDLSLSLAPKLPSFLDFFVSSLKKLGKYEVITGADSFCYTKST